jgi:hypothetical protein
VPSGGGGGVESEQIDGDWLFGGVLVPFYSYYQKSVRLRKIPKKLCTEKLNKSFDLYFMKYWLDCYDLSIESSLFINPELSEKKTA